MRQAERDLPRVRSPFLVGITGDFNPLGYVAEPGRSAEEGEQVRRIRAAFESMLQWIFAKEGQGFLDANSCTFQLQGKRPRNQTDSHGRLVAYHDCWKPLAVQASPVVILSTLAPGISTLFAEVALDFRDKHPELPVSVRGVLPFSSSRHLKDDLYARADIFRSEADRRRYAALVKRMREQIDWVEQRDLFEVKLDNDWDHFTSEEDLSGIVPAVPSANLPARKRSDLRYRAAGEYIAAFSDLLVAAYDYSRFENTETPKLEDPFDFGPHAIVEAKRRGLSWELLAITNNFTWADNGPVLRLGIESHSDTHTGTDSGKSPFQLQFLHPHDAKPIHDTEDDALEAAWQANGDSIFRRILKLQDEFNQVPTSDLEENEIYAMLFSKDELKGQTTGQLDSKIQTEMGAKTLETVRNLVDAAQYRRRAAESASNLEKKRGGVMVALVMLIGLAAVFLGTFEHWHPMFHKPAHPAASIEGHHADGSGDPQTAKDHAADHKEDVKVEETQSLEVPNPHAEVTGNIVGRKELEQSEKKIKIALLLLTLECIGGAGCWYFFYNRRRLESRRFDYRALGEALRVQIYWCLSGLNSSVAANYMQRQRDELDWIRYVTSALTFPFFRWKKNFQSLSIDQRIKVLETVRTRWVKEQSRWFQDKSILFGRKAHFWHVVAWAFALTGIVQIVLMLLAESRSELGETIERNLFWTGIVLLLLNTWPTVIFLIHAFNSWEQRKRFPKSVRDWFAAYSHKHGHDEGGHTQNPVDWSLWQWMAERREIVFLSMFFTGILFVVLSYLSAMGDWAPGFVDWRIILTSSVLVFGGLSLAWVERNFYSEINRNYSSMRMLYHSADYRLTQIIKRCQKLKELNSGKGQPKQQERLIQEAQDILYNLGCEALNENAEWLILHRSRPLEPFMAG